MEIKLYSARVYNLSTLVPDYTWTAPILFGSYDEAIDLYQKSLEGTGAGLYQVAVLGTFEPTTGKVTGLAEPVEIYNSEEVKNNET